jgi:hypothetical protein
VRWVCIGLAIAAAMIAATSASGATRDCGAIFQEGVSPEKISASGETCKAARALAREVSKGTVAGGCMSIGGHGFQVAKPCVRRHYSCRPLRRLAADGTGVRVGCRRGSRTVNWDVR